MLAAGIATDKAIATLARPQTESKPTALQVKLQRAAAQVSKGSPLSKALAQQRCLNRADEPLLTSAEAAGRVAQALQFISERQCNKAQHIKSLKAGMVMPIAVLAVGVLAGLFIKLLSGTSLLTAIKSLIVPTAMVLLAIHLIIRALQVDTRVYLSVIWRVPVLCDALAKYSVKFQVVFEQCFYRPLLWQFQSGVAFEHAVVNNQNLLNSARYRQLVRRSAKQVGNGSELGDALADNKLIMSKRLYAVFRVGQYSGAFETALSSELNIQHASIERYMSALIRWLPRLAYVMVLTVLARVIL